MKHQEVGDGLDDAEDPDDADDDLGPDLGVTPLERVDDSPVAVQRDDDQGEDGRVDAQVLKIVERNCRQ